MLRLLLLSLILLSNLCLGFDCHSDNLANDKKVLSQYLHSGQYDHDVEKVVQQAKAYLKNYVSKHGNERCAIVFDIDSTILTDLYASESYGFGGNSKIFDAIVKTANLKPIKPVVDLFNWAVEHNVAVFFITGRSDALSLATYQNLKFANISGWQKIYFWPKNSKFTVQEFKARSRQDITNLGYKIVLNMGDQSSDLQGGYALKEFKLPNPFYLIPSNQKRNTTKL